MKQKQNQWDDNEQDYIRFLSDKKDSNSAAMEDIPPEHIVQIIYESSQLPKIDFLREQKLKMKNLISQTNQKLEVTKERFKQLAKETNSKYGYILEPAKQKENKLFFHFKKTLLHNSQYQKYKKKNNHTEDLSRTAYHQNFQFVQPRSISQDQYNTPPKSQVIKHKPPSHPSSQKLKHQFRIMPRKTYTTKHYRFHSDSIFSNADLDQQPHPAEIQDKVEIEDFILEENEEKEKNPNTEIKQSLKSLYTVIEPKKKTITKIENDFSQGQSQNISNYSDSKSNDNGNRNNTIQEVQEENRITHEDFQDRSQQSFFQTEDKSHQRSIKKVQLSKTLEADRKIYNQLLKLPIKKDTKLNLQHTIDIVYLNEIDKFINRTNELLEQQRRNAKNRKNDLVILQQQYERQSKLNLMDLHFQRNQKEAGSSVSSSDSDIGSEEVQAMEKPGEMDKYYSQLTQLNRQLNQKQKEYLKDLCYSQLINDNQFQLMNQTLLNLLNKKINLIKIIMKKPLPQKQVRKQKFRIDKYTLIKESEQFLDMLSNISFKMKKYKISKNLINRCNNTLQQTNTIESKLNDEKKDIKLNEKLILEFIQIIKQLQLMDPSVFNYILNYKVYSTTDEDLNIIYDIHKLKQESFERKARSCNQYFDIDKEKRRQLEKEKKKKRKDYF